jgi:hypothetical protein
MLGLDLLLDNIKDWRFTFSLLTMWALRSLQAYRQILKLRCLLENIALLGGERGAEARIAHDSILHLAAHARARCVCPYGARAYVVSAHPCKLI